MLGGRYQRKDSANRLVRYEGISQIRPVPEPLNKKLWPATRSDSTTCVNCFQQDGAILHCARDCLELPED